jgi:DHA3 family macrolide efflux protein-like MFS transporter
MYRLSSSLRSRSVEESLKYAEEIAPRLGITRVTDTTWLDRVGIPVFASIRPAAAAGSLCVNAGKGLREIEAKVGAYMEAMRTTMLSKMPSSGWRLWRLQWSFFLLTIGARCTQLAVAWWALKETGSASLFSVMVACSVSAEVLAKPLLGWTGDRYPKTTIVLICNVLSIVATVGLFILSLGDHFAPALVAISMMLLGFTFGVRDPIQSSIIPQLAPPGAVTDAFNRKALLSSIAMLLGPSAAGLLVSVSGVSLALGVDCAVSLVALAIVLTVKLDARSLPASDGTDAREIPVVTPWHQLIGSGFKVVFKVKMEFYLALLAMMINLVLFPFFAVIVPFYVQEVAHLPAWYIGLLDCSFGIGILCASRVLARFFSTRVFRDRLVMIGFSLLGTNLLALGLATPRFILPFFFVLGGIGLIFINVNTSMVRTLATPPEFRNRMVATVSFLSALASPVGSLFIAFSLPHYGVHTT